MTHHYKMPSLFIVGAAKAGTTSLATALTCHPDFFLSKLKEPNFFADLAYGNLSRPRPPVIRSWRSYLSLYRKAPLGSICIDASPTYLWSKSSARNIASHITNDIRIVAILRDPVDRAYSNYLNDVREGIENRSFLDAITEEINDGTERKWFLQSVYVNASLYADGVKRFIDTFGRGNVLVIFYEDLIQRKGETLAEVARFAGAEPFAWTDDMFPHENYYGQAKGELARRLLSSGYLRQVSRMLVPASWRNTVHWALIEPKYQKPPLSADACQRLKEYFKTDVRNLKALLECNPPWHGYDDENRT